MFCLGIYITNYPLMVLGRIINGFGSGPTTLSTFTLTKLYIDDKNLMLVNSMVMVTSRIVFSASYYSNPKMYLYFRSFDMN